MNEVIAPEHQVARSLAHARGVPTGTKGWARTTQKRVPDAHGN